MWIQNVESIHLTKAENESGYKPRIVVSCDSRFWKPSNEQNCYKDKLAHLKCINALQVAGQLKIH